MNKHDRLDMLDKLTVLGEKNMSILSVYVDNHHYPAIYTLYNLLNESKVDYNELSFDEPNIISEDEIYFICDIDSKNIKRINKYLSSVDNVVKCLRKEAFNIQIDEIDNNTAFHFVKE